jgi:hypothetical protein
MIVPNKILDPFFNSFCEKASKRIFSKYDIEFSGLIGVNSY